MQIYIARDGQHHGPYDLEAVRAGLGTGSFSPADLAWYEGAPQWAPLSTLPGLQEAPAPAPAPGPTPAPPVFPAAPAAPAPYVPPANPSPAVPVYDANAPWARGAGGGGGGLWKSLPVRIGLGVLGVIAIVSGVGKIIHGVRSMSGSSSSSASADASPGTSPAEATGHFVNNRADCTGNAATHYLDFHFDYPASWTLKKGADCSTPDNFVEVDHPMNVQGSDILAERFSASSFYAYNRMPAVAVLPRLGPQLVAQIERSLRQESPDGYRKISEGSTKFNSYDAYEYRAETTTEDDNGGKTRVWTRWVMVAPPAGSDGALLMFSTSSRVPGMHGAEDVGAKGGLAVIARSFQLGR